jgi:hypothetical protein
MRDDRATDVEYELVDYDPRPMLKGTPWLLLAPLFQKGVARNDVNLQQVTDAYWKLRTESKSVLWANGYRKGIYVHFENSAQGRAESTRLEGTKILDGFFRICNYR